MIGKPWRELNAVVAATLLLLGFGASELPPGLWSTPSQTGTADRSILRAGAPGVSISEFMAAPNDTAGSDALRDEDGDVVDWIEIQNPGATAADLSGWYLTDRSDTLDRWRFPAGTRVRPHGYLVVMASGKDRRDNPLWLHTNFSLRREGEYLALVSPAGAIVSSFAPEYPVQYTGVAFGHERLASETGDEVLSEASYMRIATPGAANPIYLGPVILAVRHHPKPLRAQQNLLVTATLARVEPVAAVMLHYRFGFGPELTARMDWHGDNNYSAEIPTATQSAGALVRYYVTAGGSASGYDMAESRWPLPCRRPALPYRSPWRLTQVWLPEIHASATTTIMDPDVIRCPAYEGTIVDPGQVEGVSNLPVLYWYIQEDPVYGWEWYRAGYDAVIQSGRPAWAFLDPGASVTVSYAGALYDNVTIRLRGAGTLVFSKKGLSFAFNRDYEFALRGDEIVGGLGAAAGRFDIIDIATTGEDESYVRQPIGFETYRKTQNPAPLSFPIRLELNSHFFSVANFVEDANGDFLVRNQLDPAGAHFKIYENALTLGGFSDPATGARQRRPDWIDRRPALRKLILGLNQHQFEPVAGRAKTTAYVFDHVNVPGLINYMATRTLLDDFDTLWHNYDLYQDLAAIPGESDERLWPGTGEWWILPQDKDHVLFDGWTYPAGAGHPYYGATGYTDRPNGLIDAVIQSDVLRAMYLRRLRTLVDERFGTPGGGWLAESARQLLAKVEPEALLDSTRWIGANVAATDKPISSFNPSFLPQQIERRRHELQDTGAGTYGALLPPRQWEENVHFGPYLSGQRLSNTAITLMNCGQEAADITGWELSSGAGLTYTFKPGTVIPGDGGMLHVTPDVRAFRIYQRWLGAAEMLGLFVQGGFDPKLIGNWQGGAYLPAAMMLRNRERVVADNSTPGACPKVFLPQLLSR